MSEQLSIRRSAPEDLPRIMEIYAQARDFMAAHGNPRQWGATSWPPEALIRRDIAEGKSYVCLAGERIAGTFFFDLGRDIEPCYRKMYGGSWIGDEEYGVVHRIATDHSVRGCGRFCIRWAIDQCGHLRIDTHGDNHVMQNFLKSMGFTYCGIIHVEEDDDPRLAFEIVEEIPKAQSGGEYEST